MAINTSNISNLLRPGLAAVFGDYDLYPAQWTEIFTRHESDKGFEVEQEMKMTGLASIRAEGAATAVDTMGQRFSTTYVHKYIGLMTIITRQAIMDNLYKTKFPMQAKALKRSLMVTKDVLGASVLNNGFNTNFPIGDGQKLFSTDHPIDTGTVANTPAIAADLNEASLEQAIIAIQQFQDQAGLIVQTKPSKLIVPAHLQFAAERLLESTYRTGTANNDVSAIYNLSSVPQGYRVNQYLNDTNAWFLLTDAPEGFKHYVREEIQHDVYADPYTDNLIAKAVERYSFGVSNFRAAYGSPGT